MGARCPPSPAGEEGRDPARSRGFDGGWGSCLRPEGAWLQEALVPPRGARGGPRSGPHGAPRAALRPGNQAGRAGPWPGAVTCGGCRAFLLTITNIFFSYDTSNKCQAGKKPLKPSRCTKGSNETSCHLIFRGN